MVFEWRLSRVEFRGIDIRRQYASPIYSTEIVPFLISNFRRVLNVVCFLLGDSPASEFYMPTFRNTPFHLHRQVGACTIVPFHCFRFIFHSVVRVSFNALNSDEKLKTFHAIENLCFVWIISRAPYRFVVFRRIVMEVRYIYRTSFPYAENVTHEHSFLNRFLCSKFTNFVTAKVSDLNLNGVYFSILLK
jgi:hypothetical protein